MGGTPKSCILLGFSTIVNIYKAIGGTPFMETPIFWIISHHEPSLAIISHY